MSAHLNPSSSSGSSSHLPSTPPARSVSERPLTPTSRSPHTIQPGSTRLPQTPLRRSNVPVSPASRSPRSSLLPNSGSSLLHRSPGRRNRDSTTVSHASETPLGRTTTFTSMDFSSATAVSRLDSMMRSRDMTSAPSSIERLSVGGISGRQPPNHRRYIQNNTTAIDVMREKMHGETLKIKEWETHTFEITLNNLSSLQSHFSSLPTNEKAPSSFLSSFSRSRRDAEAYPNSETGEIVEYDEEFPQEIVEDLRVVGGKFRLDLVGMRMYENKLPALEDFGASMEPELNEDQILGRMEMEMEMESEMENVDPLVNTDVDAQQHGEKNQGKSTTSRSCSRLEPAILLYLAHLNADSVPPPPEPVNPNHQPSSSARSSMSFSSNLSVTSSSNMIDLDQQPSSKGSTRLFLGLKISEDPPVRRKEQVPWSNDGEGEENENIVFETGQGGKSRWLWTKWDTFDFNQDARFWQCEFPSLASLIANPTVAQYDAVTMIMQIQMPDGDIALPLQPGLQVVPSEVVNGLANLLDSANTGDVQFICQEHREEEHGSGNANDDTTTCHTRKRILWAHSEILKSRSAYFRDLFCSGFNETICSPLPSIRGSGNVEPQRRTITVTAEEADFTTMYWLIYYLYTGEIEFSTDADIRKVVATSSCNTRHSPGESVKGQSKHNEWDWNEISLSRGGSQASELDDVRTVNSTTSASSNVTSRVSSSKSREPRTSTITGRTQRLAPTSTPALRRVPPSRSGQTANRPPTAAPEEPQSAIQHPYPAYLHPARSKPDPNPHPTPRPAPASAFGIFCVAHRYRLVGLQRLAQAHLLDCLTSENACPLLLASFVYDDLHKMVQDYIVEHWKEVQGGPELLRCIQDVSHGLWGNDGGLSIHGLFSRLQAG